MDYRVSSVDRAAFKRCRRQWDLGSSNRRNLQPIDSPVAGLDAAVRDALATYYYPGMWDWSSHIVLPLVRKAFMRVMAAVPASPRRTAEVDLGTELLERYFAWAPSLDDFCPLFIETDVESLVPDVREENQALVAGSGGRVLYTDRIPLLAIDDADECWVVRHHVLPTWHDLSSLLLDEAAATACWAWEQTYLGMDIAGTLHNEILCPWVDEAGTAPARTRTGRPGRGGHSQNEPSGGGRLTPNLQRRDRIESRSAPADRVRQESAGGIRRTRIRRSREEIQTSARQLGTEVLSMLDPNLSLYPTPAAMHCPQCSFVDPCLTMMEGGDPELDLATRFRECPPENFQEPRLGAGGRGGRYVPIPPTS